MSRFRKATIRDVAARSGVSTTTVSNFVSGRENVCSPATAARIREAVTALHYVPSSLTRGLRHKPSATIGVCLANPLEADVSFGAHFLERLWRGILAQADAESYALIHYPRAVREGPSCGPLLDGRADALLLHADARAEERAAQLADAGMPTVLINGSRGLPPGCAAVWADDAGAAALALQHLWRLGHRRIAHVAGPVGRPPAGADAAHTGRAADIAVSRLDGYTIWLTARGAYDPALVAFADAWAAPRARRYLQAWRALPQPPTAVLCANDAQALDVLAAARSEGVRVPEDLSVVGVDNAQAARDCGELGPSLTSVEPPMQEVGAEALRQALRLIRGVPAEECRIAVPVTRLVVRGSSGPAPAR